MLSDIYSSNSNFLKAEDIHGKKPIVTIKEATVQEKDYGDGQGLKKQIILSFTNTEKVLGLNFTNASKIAELLGTEDFEEWVGKSIKLYEDKTKVNGAVKPCIRIFPELPTVNAASVPQMRPNDARDDIAPDDTIGSDIPF